MRESLRTWRGPLVGGLAALFLSGCPTSQGTRLEVQPELAPKFELSWDPDQGTGSDALRLELDTSTWGQALIVGGYFLEGGAAMEIVVEDPFDPARKVRGVGPGGASTPLVFDSYADLPAGDQPVPQYGGFAVIPEYSPADRGTYLHIVVGAEPKSGVRVFVGPQPMSAP